MPKSTLSPVIGLGRLVGLTFAVIAPASSVFLTFGTAFTVAGTGIVLGYAVGSLVNLLIMLGYAEVGSRFPESGGDYALAARALGRRAGSVYTVLFLVKGMAIPALLALSTAAYVHQLWPRWGLEPTAIVIFLLFLGLASIDIRTSSTVITAMVALEFLVFVLFLIAGFHHFYQPLSLLWHPIKTYGSNQVIPVRSHLWMGAAIAALYGLNGPQSCLYYSEESQSSPKQLGRTIIAASLITIGIELLGVTVGTLALPHLTASAGGLPLAMMVKANLGPIWGGTVLVAGMAVALFDTGLATTMSYARIFYAIARDGQWPGPIRRIAGWVDGRGVPLGALGVLGAINLAVMLGSGIQFLVTLGGSLLIIIYGGIACASLKTRYSPTAAPYQMGAWPWPPLIALAGLALLTVHLERPQLIITGLVVLLGFAWSWLVPASNS